MCILSRKSPWRMSSYSTARPKVPTARFLMLCKGSACPYSRLRNSIGGTWHPLRERTIPVGQRRQREGCVRGAGVGRHKHARCTHTCRLHAPMDGQWLRVRGVFQKLAVRNLAVKPCHARLIPAQFFGQQQRALSIIVSTQLSTPTRRALHHIREADT